MNRWYEIKAKSESESDVLIYNEIGGWGITAEAFANDIGKIKAKTINVRINSPGGSAFDAFAIFNALRNHEARIVAHVDGLAASAASVIMLAGDETRIAKNGYVMIHEASSGAWGPAGYLRKQADLLEKLNGTIADTYAGKTKKSRTEMLAMMSEETWFTADEAKAAGLVDSITDEAKDLPASAHAAAARFQKTPENLRRIAAMYIDPSDPNASTGANAPGAKVANPSLEKTMNLENFKAFATEHPEAVASYLDQGKKTGAAEARAEFKKLLEASAGNTAVAIEAFYAGHDAEAVKATVAAIAKATADSAAAIKAKDAEIENLKAQIGTQGPINTAGAAKKDAEAPTQDLSPKAQADAEWESGKVGNATLDKNKWVNKAAYVGFRTRELQTA